MFSWANRIGLVGGLSFAEDAGLEEGLEDGGGVGWTSTETRSTATAPPILDGFLDSSHSDDKVWLPFG